MGRPKKDQTKAETHKSTEEVGFALPSGISIDRDNIKVVVTDEEKERFYKCFITDTTFEDEKPLFDGKTKVVFKSITVDENNDIWRQVSKDQAAGLAGGTESTLLLISIYRLAMSLYSIDGVPFFTLEITKDNYEVSIDKPNTTYVRAKADKFKDWGTFKCAIFLRAFAEFESKLFQLEKEVTTPNFWKAAE